MTQGIKKAANAFYKNAEVDSWMATASPFWFFDIFLLARTIKLSRRFLGGLWVGGSVVLSETSLQFFPNWINRAVHAAVSIEPIRILYSQLNAVDRRFGILTGIIDVAHRDGLFTVRCFNAKAFVAELNRRRAKMV